MQESWYKEYWTFLIVPVLATAACCFIPLFRGEQGMNSMAILPLTTAFSYGHTLAPSRTSYENSWEKLMDYPSFVLASVKRTLLFAIPTALTGWIASLFWNGYLKELATFFEIAAWGLMSGICLYGLVTYTEETYKLRKSNKEEFKAKMANLWKWIIPPAVGSLLLAISKGCLLFDTLKGRS